MSQASDFERLNQQASAGLITEFWQFIRENKAWWMVPILLVLSLFGALVVLAGTGLAPFIYTIF